MIYSPRLIYRLEVEERMGGKGGDTIIRKDRLGAVSRLKPGSGATGEKTRSCLVEVTWRQVRD